jgi:prevent-host-death family protein
MPTVTAIEAEAHFGDLLERVTQGEEIVITRHDRPVARIIPEGRRSHDRTQSAVAGLRALRAEIGDRTRAEEPLTMDEIDSAVAEGRP